jgi:rhamnopyranosyl-N-acetylglucosaminyl-diphospho-decaprenol beta-1,3/1,4-galactofuranosyltransferase
MRAHFDADPQSGAVGAGRQAGRPVTVAIVVTNNRPRDLERLLDALERQSVPLARIVVVDNGGSGETPGIVDGRPLCERINGRANLGGAGGFALGMLHGLTTGATHLWVMDDDGMPAADDTLAALHEGMERQGWEAASPLVLDIADRRRVAFPFKIGLRLFTEASDIRPRRAVAGFAHLFNGMLIRAETLMRTGVPDLRLFIRGDEVDFYLRMRRSKVRFGTLTAAEFLHPSSRSELVPILPGLLHAVWPLEPLKQQTFFRNRGFLIRTHRLWPLLLRDALTYPWFFLVMRRGDLPGMRLWASAVWAGARGRF